jgi:hypothetical protein
MALSLRALNDKIIELGASARSVLLGQEGPQLRGAQAKAHKQLARTKLTQLQELDDFAREGLDEDLHVWWGRRRTGGAVSCGGVLRCWCCWCWRAAGGLAGWLLAAAGCEWCGCCVRIPQPTVQARFWLLSLADVQFSPGCRPAAAAEKFPEFGKLFQYDCTAKNSTVRVQGHEGLDGRTYAPAAARARGGGSAAAAAAARAAARRRRPQQCDAGRARSGGRPAGRPQQCQPGPCPAPTAIKLR